jgi:hypothetical protein
MQEGRGGVFTICPGARDSAKIVSAIFYEHALAAILAVSVIHASPRHET